MKIKTCSDCGFQESERVYTADSWEMVHKWTCKMKKKIIDSYVDTFDKVAVPKWCPLRAVKNLIKDTKEK